MQARLVVALCAGSWLLTVPTASGADPRQWVDSTGKYRVIAEFVGYQAGQVQLKRESGAVIQVPLERLSLTDQVYAICAADGESVTPPKSNSLGIKISRETTYLVCPFTDEGYVDYVAALELLSSHGVTQEDNAAVPFMQAVGPGIIPEDQRRGYFESLGIPPLEEDGQYFRSLSAYLEQEQGITKDGQEDQWNAIHDGQSKAMQRPWSEEEFPLVAAWLEANAAPLKLLAEATRRPRFQKPVLTDQEWEGLIGLRVPEIEVTRDVARALSARAMLHTQRGDTEAAWQHLLACHRLARLIAQEHYLVAALVGVAIEGIVCQADAGLVHLGRPTAEQTKRMLRDLEAIGPLPEMSRTIPFERLVGLDVISMVARGGPAAAIKLEWLLRTMGAEQPGPDDQMDAPDRWPDDFPVDWSQVLRTYNERFDELDQAFRIPKRPDRKAAFERINAQMVTRQTALKMKLVPIFGGKEPDPSVLRDPAVLNKVAQTLGSEGFAEMFCALLMVRPSPAGDRAAMRYRVTCVAFALAACKTEHGAYPDTLDQLVPNYMARLPGDLFSDGPLRYSREGSGYLLYSLGQNGKDDGGKTFGEGEGTDDIVVRSPPEGR